MKWLCLAAGLMLAGTAQADGTDDYLAGLRALAVVGSHQVVVTGGGRASATHPRLLWVNTMLGNVQTALREVRLALLEADVNFKVVKDFVERVKERALGQDVLKSLSPGQQVV